MVQSTKTFRVFVSSTFSDLKEERNALQREVFPKLRELCMEHGFRFQAIDLRWGVSEEAGLDQQTMKICLEEIERSQRVSPKPNFIVLLGDRYGWRPLHYEILADEFEEILDKVPEKDKPFLSWKGDLLDDEKLKKREGWYCLDTNALDPVYCLKSRLIDYDENDPDDLIKKTKEKESKDWYEKEERIKTLLLNAIEELNWPENDPRRSKYEDSATEQEIINGVLEPPKNIPHPEEHVFCFFREIDDKGSINYNEDSENFLDFDESKKIDELSAKKLELLKEEIRKKLPEKNIITYQTSWNGNSVKNNHLDDLCRDVYLSLACTIMKQIEEYEEKDPLDLEIEAHKEFGKERCKFFIGREENRGKIKNYLETPNSKPMIVYGESGSGKSALMAKAIEDSSTDFYEMNEDGDLYNDGLVVRFIGATPESSDLHSLLESLSRQITKIYDEDDSNIPTEYNDLVQDFKERLNFATNEKPLIIYIDALDQLSDSENAHNLTWIPSELPENVCVVLSTLKRPFKDSIENRIPYENTSEVEPLKKSDGESILNSWLSDLKRKLSDEQENGVINKFEANGLPLYLKLAFEEAKRWKSYTPVPDIKPNIKGIIHYMFERLSRPENHGKILVSHSLGYLSAAKNGLTEDEMLDILAKDTEVFNLTNKFHKPPEKKLPVALWSRLYFDLEPYLTERSADGTSLLTFYHRQLGEVVEEEYLTKNVKKERHQHLADYFYKQDLSFDKEGKKEFNIRKVSELPYQETYGEYWEHLEETLCDLRFVEAKCAVGRTYELIKDYYLALDMHPDAQEDYKKKLEDKKRVDKYINDLITYSKGEIDHLDIIPSVRPWTEEEIQKETERIINNPKPLDRIKAFSQFVNSKSHAFAEFGYMPSFCLQQAYNSANKGPIAKNAKKIIKENLRSPLILRDENWLPEYNPHQALIKILEGHTETVSAVAITPEGKTAITGSDDKTVRVWDLETGEQLQKIDSIETVSAVAITPDGKTAITGSDDKTVQVWDLETEEKLKKLSHKDRVSCAAVTPDGKTAITGSDDKTVRVWNLETGEQLQKINSTETVSAVAITPDGKKAILIFYDAVQVWDLEIRKLLKILRGHIYMMISVAITPDGKTAITGSNDGTLGIWNLETGKKGKKIGHSRSLNAITIAPDGKTAITGSDDKTVRVWNLETGEQLQKIDHNKKVSTVTITPDNKRLITGCHDGIVRVWNLETGEQLHKLDCTEWVNAVAITPEGKRLITGCRDGTVRVWDLETEEKILTLGYSEEGITFALNVDGKTIITQIDGTTLTLDEKETEETQLTIGHAENGSKVNITPDGKTALIQNDDKTVKVENLDTGKLISIFNAKKQILILNHTEDIFHVTVTPDGKKVITGSDEGIIRVWDLETGKQLQKLGRKQWVEVVTVTPDGKTAITSDDKDNILLVWDLETGEQLQKLEHKKIVRVVAVTPDGKTAITGSDDRTVRVWNLESGRLIFISKEDLDIIALAIKRSSFLYGTFTGDLVFSYLVNIDIDIPLITASRIWLFEKNRCFGYWDDNITANCHCCWNRFKVSDEMLDRITEIKNQHKKPDGWIADEAWDDTRLISECPLCHEKIKFNPFIIDNSEEEFTKEINDN